MIYVKILEWLRQGCKFMELFNKIPSSSPNLISEPIGLNIAQCFQSRLQSSNGCHRRWRPSLTGSWLRRLTDGGPGYATSQYLLHHEQPTQNRQARVRKSQFQNRVSKPSIYSELCNIHVHRVSHFYPGKLHSIFRIFVLSFIPPVRDAGGVEAPLDLVNALHHELPEPLQ